MTDEGGRDLLLLDGSPERRRAVRALRESFVDRWLGPWSSHPRMSVRRVTSVRRIGLAIVSAVAAFAAWRVYQAWTAGRATSAIGDFVNAVSQGMGQRRWMLVALAFSLSATLTAGLTVRASLARGTAAPSRSPAIFGWTVALMSLAAIATSVLVAWLSGSTKLGTSTRWWVLVAAMSPVSLLIFWFGLFPRNPSSSGDSDDEGRVSRATSMWSMLRATITPVLLSASSLLLSPDIARPLSGATVKFIMGFTGVPIVGKIMAPFAKPIANVLGTTIFQFVGMGCATAIATLAVARVTRDVHAAATASGAIGPGASMPARAAGGVLPIVRGLLRVLAAPFRWVASIFRRRPKEASEAPGGSSPPMAGAGPELAVQLTRILHATIDPSIQVDWMPAVASPGEGADSSAPHPLDELDWLFGGRRPTADQVAILEAFDERWREHSVAVERGEFGNQAQSHSDIFVEAAVDRGVLSSTLRACALFACVARGQRVLFLVEDEAQRQAQVDELQAAMLQLRFEALYRVGSLDPSEVATWCPIPSGTGATRDAEPPDIIVATPGDYDRVLLSGTFEPVLVRSFLLSIEVIVIDGLQRLTRRDAWLLHLPFLVDKHRLLLRNENRALQLVIGSAPVSDEWARASASASICRERIAVRLFGGDGRVAGHFFALRPAFLPKPAMLRVSAPDALVAQTLGRVVDELFRAFPGGEVSVLDEFQSSQDSVDFAALEIDGSAGAGEALEQDAEASASEASLLESDGGDPPDFADGDPRRISLRMIRLLGGEFLNRIGFVVVPAGVDRVARRRLQSMLGSRESPIIVEIVPSSAGIDRPKIDAASAALPVFVSAGAPAMFLPHLRSAVPAMRADAPTRREDFARFGLSWDEERWRSHASSMNPLRLHEGWFLETDGNLAAYASAGDSQFAWPAVFVRRDEAVRWNEVRPEAPPDEGLCLLRDRERLEVALDAGHVDRRRFAVWMNSRELKLGITDLFRMSKLVLKTGRQEYRPMLLRDVAGSTQIEAEPRALEGDDFVIPKTFTTISLPSDMGIDGPYAVRGARAFLFRVREQGTALRTVETIVGLCAPSGQEIATHHVSYGVHASVTLVVLGGELPRDGQSVPDWIRASYEGPWTTMRRGRRGPRETWPLLGRAIEAALEHCAPDLLRFARIFAFRPPFGHAGASILLVETAATSGSALDAFRTLLDDADLRRTFLSAIREAVLAAPAEIPCVGPKESPSQASQSRDDALRVLDELEASGSWAPRTPDGADEMVGRVVVADTRLPHDAALLPAGTVLAPPGDSVRWTDTILCVTPGGSVELGVVLPFDAERARASTESFGWRMSDSIDDRDALLRRCVRLVGARTVGPDYGAMIQRSTEDLRPVAGQLLDLADRAGLVTVRDRIRLFAGFVQTTTYVRQRAGSIDDGIERFGVQMPVETAFARAGDCDSSSLLLVALLRAARLAPAGLMLVETEDAGHAMAVVSISPAAGDHVVRTASGDLVLVECTALHAIGQCASEYVGRHVRVVAMR